MNYGTTRRTSMLRKHQSSGFPSVKKWLSRSSACPGESSGGSGSGSGSSGSGSSPLPTYSLFSSESQINEGQSILFTLQTTHVANGTSVLYSITGISQSDLSSGNTTGNFVIADNSASVSLTLAEDLTTEGAETLTMTAGGDSASVTINDTSITTVPPTPTYQLTCSPSTVTEGGTITCTLETTNVANGTNIAYTVTGITSEDLASGDLTGNFVINNNAATKTFVIANDAEAENETFSITCDNVPTPVEVSIADSETPPPVEQPLFNKSSFVGIVPEPYLGYLNQAADRWATYIKFNPAVFAAIKASTFGWNGIKLQSYTELNNETSGVIASCGPYFYYDIQNPGPGVQFNTKSFLLTINTYFESIYNSADWVNILTHELGHALGIGIYWGSVFQPTGSIPPEDSFLLGSGYPTAQDGYNAIVEDSSLTKVPLETSGGSGTSSAHWDDNLRPSSAAGSLGKNYPGLTDELMVGFYNQGMTMILSQLSIGTLLDFGYQEVTPGSSEGIPTTASLTAPIMFSTAQGSLSSEETKTIKFNCCHNHDEMICAGTIVLSPSAI